MNVKRMALTLAASLLMTAPAFGNVYTSGEVLDITGFDNANATSKFWSGSFTLGTQTGAIWSVTAFGVDPLNCLTCTPTSPPWTFSLQFDGATGDLFGTTSANFNGLHLGVHLLDLTFADGNITSDPWKDTNKFGGVKTGTFSYCIGANCTNPSLATPEPPSSLLLVSGLMFLALWRRMALAR